jgi:hypothetical protein
LVPDARAKKELAVVEGDACHRDSVYIESLEDKVLLDKQVTFGLTMLLSTILE